MDFHSGRQEKTDIWKPVCFRIVKDLFRIPIEEIYLFILSLTYADAEEIPGKHEENTK